MSEAVDAYDVIIIGTGARGCTLARHLAPSGRRILLLERGGWLRRAAELGCAVNPALTAMANSLRVGDHLLERLA